MRKGLEENDYDLLQEKFGSGYLHSKRELNGGFPEYISRVSPLNHDEKFMLLPNIVPKRRKQHCEICFMIFINRLLLST
jgi:hypothetical protein